MLAGRWQGVGGVLIGVFLYGVTIFREEWRYIQHNMMNMKTKNIVVIYDGDEAGQHAIERSSKLRLQGGMNVSVVILEDGNDPDSYIKEKGQEEFLSYLAQNTQDAISYQIEYMLHTEEPPVIYSQKLSAILKEISFIQNPVQQVVYLHRCAEKTGIGQTILYKLLENFK